MTALLTGDLHKTDNPRDEYRWELFPWLREQIEKYKVSNLFLLGDLTDAKDRHSATLVNRFADEIAKTSQLCSVDVIPGNHDSIDRACPFFEFLDHIPRVRFHLKKAFVDTPAGSFLLLPNTKNYKEEWDDVSDWFSRCKYILTHQTYDGAKAENGQELSGIPPSFFKAFKGEVYSGDVHVPQRISKNIEHVGAPYRIHFGDSFSPRVLLVRKSGAESLATPFKKRELCVLRDLRDMQKASYAVGSQIKARVLLKRSEYPEWPKLRKQIAKLASDRGWELCVIELAALKSQTREIDADDETESSSTPEDILRLYAETKKLPKEIRAIGSDILKEVQK